MLVVPRLQRSTILAILIPALPGWAEVLTTGPPGLASIAIFAVSSLHQLATGNSSTSTGNSSTCHRQFINLPQASHLLGMTKWGFALPCNGVDDGWVEPPQKLFWTRLILSRPCGTQVGDGRSHSTCSARTLRPAGSSIGRNGRASWVLRRPAREWMRRLADIGLSGPGRFAFQAEARRPWLA
jgi:hypothetical protein